MESDKLKLSKYDKLWLKELYRLIVENKVPSYRSLRARLYKSLPKEYNPSEIAPCYCKYHGEEITLEGVAEVDPGFDVFSKSTKVITAIKKLLIDNPEKSEVSAEEIAKLTKVSERDVSFVLRLISPYGKFWNSASGNQKFKYGYSTLRMDNDHAIFDQYLYFSNIKELLKSYYAQLVKRKPIHLDLREGSWYTGTTNEVQLNPIFKSKIDRIDRRLCFVLMPFSETWSDEIYKLIRATIESLGYQCLRADNLSGPIIIEDIWTKINQAGLVIADVTGKNPNVMYEVGIAHTVGRPTILLTQDIKEVPFDFTHLRHIEYKNSVSSANAFKRKLKEATTEIQTL